MSQTRKMMMKSFPFDKSWTLFLDRDGVMNERIVDGYIMNFEEFIPVPNLLDALHIFKRVFGDIFVVTNQQCIGKGLCTEQDIIRIHAQLNDLLLKEKILITDFLYCPHKASDQCHCRKPKPGMALQALEKHSQIDFSKSVMVGDMFSDILFGRNLGMITVYVGEKDHPEYQQIAETADYIFDSIYDFALQI